MTVGEGNASCRYVRSSVYNIPESQSTLQKSHVPFSLILSPLAELGPRDSPVPYADKTTSFVLRCQRCGAFANLYFTFKDHSEKYVCNLCDLESDVDARYLDHKTPNLEQFPEHFSAVTDMIVSDEFKINEVRGHCVLVCLDFSLEGLVNGSYYHCLGSIRSALDSLDDDMSLGFVLWDSTVSFFRFDENGDSAVISRCADPTQPVAGLAPAEVFFNVKTQREFILKILTFFETFAEQQQKNHMAEMKNTPHNLEALALVLLDFFAGQGGHVLLFASSNKPKANENAQYAAPAANHPVLKAKNNHFQQIADKLNQKAVTVDMFITSEAQIELATIGELSRRTAGTLHYYPKFKLVSDSERYFYDIFRALTVPRVFDVAMRLRYSAGLHVNDYLTPKG